VNIYVHMYIYIYLYIYVYIYIYIYVYVEIFSSHSVEERILVQVKCVCDDGLLRVFVCKLIERTPPPPGGVFFLLCSLIKNRE